ncbi:hypothetical protein [Burkholderia sp. PU8-34]
MDQNKHTAGQAWLQRAKELAQQRADASFAYGELGTEVTATEAKGVYDRSLAADRALDEHLVPAGEAIDALRLVASKTVLTSGVRAVVDAVLAKAGFGAPAPDPIRHMRICGEGL